MIEVAIAPACGCSPHCALHESAGPVVEIDCLEAALIRVRSETYGVARLIQEATDVTAHELARDRSRGAAMGSLANLRVALGLVEGFTRAALGNDAKKGGPTR